MLKGKFHVPGLAANAVYSEATKKLYTEKPDDAAAEVLLRKSAELDPTAYFAFIDIRNLLLKRGARNQALQACTQALRHAPNDQLIQESLREHIQALGSADATTPLLRNPAME